MTVTYSLSAAASVRPWILNLQESPFLFLSAGDPINLMHCRVNCIKAAARQKSLQHEVYFPCQRFAHICGRSYLHRAYCFSENAGCLKVGCIQVYNACPFTIWYDSLQFFAIILRRFTHTGLLFAVPLLLIGRELIYMADLHRSEC